MDNSCVPLVLSSLRWKAAKPSGKRQSRARGNSCYNKPNGVLVFTKHAIDRSKTIFLRLKLIHGFNGSVKSFVSLGYDAVMISVAKIVIITE